MNSPSMRRIRALAAHEYRAAVRSRILLTLVGILTVATIASVYVAAAAHRSEVADYQAYRAAATASGLDRIAPSPLAPMSLLRGAFEYLQIIGAVIAVSLVAVTGAVGIVCIGTIGNDWINASELVQLLLAYLVSTIYMTGFYALGVACSARARHPINGLVAALCVLVLFVLVTPQIGDTLDADNQVPGGLFKALGMNHADEVTILKHFSVYETLRTRIEWISFSQHYQRFVFAMADVKERYRPLDLGDLLHVVRTDLAWVLAAPAALIALQRRALRNQPTIPQGAST